MNREKLIKMGLEASLAEKVMEGLNGAFVTKARFNEVNSAWQALKEKDAEKDGLLKELEVEARKVPDLQAALAEERSLRERLVQEHRQELLQLRLDGAVDAALRAVGAIKPETVRPLLAGFLENPVFNEDGSVLGLNETVLDLAEAADTAFLFRKVPDGRLQGFVPGEERDGLPGGALDRSRMSYDELCASLCE